MQYLAHNPKFTVQEELLIDKTLEKKETAPEVEFVFTIFIAAKSYGGVLLILNLKKLTEFVKYEQFKMDGIKAILNTMSKNCYMNNKRLERCLLQC